MSTLLGNLDPEGATGPGLLDRAKALDKHDIPMRDPNGFDEGAPTDFYTAPEADKALEDIQRIVELCRDQIGFAPGDRGTGAGPRA